MNKYRNGYSKRNSLVTFMLLIIIIGFICGIIYYYKLPNVTRDTLNINFQSFNMLDKVNNITTHIIIISLIVILSFFIIGLPIAFFYLFYEGLAIGFSFIVYYKVKKFKGIILALIYNLIYKFIFLFLLFIFIFKIIDIIYNILRYLFYKKTDEIKVIIFNKVKNTLMIIFLLILNDIVIFFAGPHILKLFKFLL